MSSKMSSLSDNSRLLTSFETILELNPSAAPISKTFSPARTFETNLYLACDIKIVLDH